MYRNGLRNCSSCVRLAVCAIVIATIGAGSVASAQTPPPEVSFEVATIKPVDPSLRFNPNHFGSHVSSAFASYWSMTLVSLVTRALGVQPLESTGPVWANADRFDIEAKFPEGADKKDERRMLQALLKDRFKLSFHLEERQLDSYVLAIAKHGEKLTPSSSDPANSSSAAPVESGGVDTGEAPAAPKIIKKQDGSSTLDFGNRGTETMKFDEQLGAMHLESSKMTMGQLAIRLSTCMGSGLHQVVDETGLIGTYQIAYDCPVPTRQSQSNTDAGTLQSAMRGFSTVTRSLDALGLRLERRTTPQQVYVIDHVEKPSEN
jgi:uncharacterized protein (TIGR03435 family)